MTSRISFSKLLKETFRRHFTSLLVVTLAFLIHFVVVILNLQNTLDLGFAFYESNLEEYLARIFAPNYENGIFAIGTGLFMAFDYFKYLHSRKETDFYESLPITKQTMFLVNTVCPFVIFAVLALVTLGFELLVLFVMGYGTSHLVIGTFWTYIIMLGGYLSSFALAALAWIMTGHPIIGLLGYGAFTVYAPFIIANLFPTYARIFFDCYVRVRTFSIDFLNHILDYLSPASIMILAAEKSGDFWTLKGHVLPILLLWIFAFLIFALAITLYRKRPAESAGRAMAFERVNSIIRICLTIPFALYVGLFLHEVSSMLNSVWLMFGVLFGGFVFHGVLEAIFEADVRAAFRKKIQLLLVYGCCIAFVSIFYFDLFKFEDYIPSESQIEAVYMDFRGMFYSNATPSNPDGLTGEDAVEALNVISDIRNTDFSMDGSYDTFEVVYTLKNGTSIYREYRIMFNELPASLDALSEKESFKDDLCMLYNFDVKNFQKVYVQANQKDIHLQQNELEELMSTYLREFTELSIKDMYSTSVVCYIIGEEPIKDYVADRRFAVYECFDETIALLKKNGFVPFHEDEDLTLIRLEIYDGKYEDGFTCQDLDVLAELKPYVVLNNYNYHKDGYDFVYGTVLVNGPAYESYYDIYIPRTIFEQYFH